MNSFVILNIPTTICRTEAKILSVLDYIDVKNLAHRIQCSVAMVTGLEDEVCPPSTQFAIFNRLETTNEIRF